MSVRDTMIESVRGPVQIMFLDPTISFGDVCTALQYPIFSSFFESFPLVYPVMFDFNAGELGLIFPCTIVSVIIVLTCYI